MTNNLDRIFSQAPETSVYAKRYCEYLAKLLSELDYKQIAEFIEKVRSTREQNKTIYFIGNGGSAATCSHFANDLAIGTRCTGRPYKVMSLTDNLAIITAIGNDFGYDKIFSKQLEVYLEPGDLLVAISASGNSPNIIEAVKFAKSKGNTVVGLTGFDGGELKKLSDISVHCHTPKGEYGPVEDIHMVIDHLMGSFLMRLI